MSRFQLMDQSPLPMELPDSKSMDFDRTHWQRGLAGQFPDIVQADRVVEEELIVALRRRLLPHLKGEMANAYSE